MVTQETASFCESIDRFSALQADSLRRDAFINMQVKQAELFERTITELEAERRAHADKLEGIESLLQSSVSQTSQLKEDVATAEQLAAARTASAMLDAHDCDPDLGEDAERRQQRAKRRAEEVHCAVPNIRSLSEMRM